MKCPICGAELINKTQPRDTNPQYVCLGGIHHYLEQIGAAEEDADGYKMAKVVIKMSLEED